MLLRAGTHNTEAKIVVAVVRQIATSLAICVTVRNRRVVSVVIPRTTAVNAVRPRRCISTL